MKKIIITEEERNNILSSHSFKTSFIKNNLKEALDKTNGIYTTETDQIAIGTYGQSKGKQFKIPAKTKVYHNFNDKTSTLIYVGQYFTYYCDTSGYTNLFDDNQGGKWKNDDLTKKIREIYCNGKKIKSWSEITGQQKKTESSVKGDNVNSPKDIKGFQDWLDLNHSGWTTNKSYKTLDKLPSRGYGKYGPLTTAAWKLYKDEYLKSNPSQVTPSQETPSQVTPSQVTPTQKTEILTGFKGLLVNPQNIINKEFTMSGDNVKTKITSAVKSAQGNFLMITATRPKGDGTEEEFTFGFCGNNKLHFAIPNDNCESSSSYDGGDINKNLGLQ